VAPVWAEAVKAEAEALKAEAGAAVKAVVAGAGR